MNKDNTDCTLIDKISDIPFKYLFLTKDRITINPNEYRAFDLIDYMNENKINEEDLTLEELEKFRIKED